MPSIVSIEVGVKVEKWIETLAAGWPIPPRNSRPLGSSAALTLLLLPNRRRPKALNLRRRLDATSSEVTGSYGDAIGKAQKLGVSAQQAA